MPKPITQNTLFYGDNLPILREHLSDESIDLVYLDPPFNSNRSYGVFITLEAPTGEMVTEAVSAGYFTSKVWQKDYPRIQVLTVEELLAGKGIEMPPSAYGTFKQAGKVKKEDATQDNLM